MENILGLIKHLEKEHIQHREETEKFKQDMKQEVAVLKNTINNLKLEIKLLKANSTGEKNQKNVLNSNDNKLRKCSNEKSTVNDKEKEENGLKESRKKSKVNVIVEPNGSKNIWDAIRRGLISAIQFWIQRDAELLKNNKRPLHFAVEYGNLAIVKFFLEDLKEDMDDKEPLSLLTPLHLACIYGHFDIVEYLLSKGADLEAKSKTFDTPLHQAAFHGHLEVVRHLVGRGANLKYQNNLNKTPAETAEGAQRAEVMDYLNKLTTLKVKAPIPNKY